MLFFSNNKLFSLLLLLVSFFNPYAGLTGLVATIMAIAISYSAGLNKFLIEKGTYSYNALVLGIGIGTMYNFSKAFWLLLVVVIVLSVILSAVFQSRLAKYNLPFLTLPFILCMWLVQLGTTNFSAINFSIRNIYWLNEMYAIGDEKLVKFVMFLENMNVPPLVATFFKALSSLYFQNNILAGIIIAAGIIIHSRIIFSLILIGFLSAYGFNSILMAHPEGMNYYLLGGNFILVSVAIGGFFTIPGKHSYLWAIISVPITFLIAMALGKMTGQLGLPVYSMPFCITVLSLLYFFSIKAQKGKIVLTPLQLYSPEKNLYNYLSNTERLKNAHTIRLQLPFMGKWMVSQGYDGNLTHKGDWSKALDFIIVDNELKTYKNYATQVDDFYCYGKPILAPADGFVQYIDDYIDDNAIGKINHAQNWGNSIVIKHAEGLYSKMSHLRKNSFKVAVGDYVRQGDVVAACGNSGRSPEPHLHFQVQATPYVGSKTFAYPLSFFLADKMATAVIKEFATPQETEIVYNATPNNILDHAFEFLPGSILLVSAPGFEQEKWEVFTDAFNNFYIYCHNTKAVAYFKRNKNVFYFTAYEGNKNTLLYYFYLAAYKIYLSNKPALPAVDKFPLQLSKASIHQWLQDFIAPFLIFSRLHYQSQNGEASSDMFNTAINIYSKQIVQFLHIKKVINQFTIVIKDNKISSFTFTKNKTKITAVCAPKEY